MIEILEKGVLVDCIENEEGILQQYFSNVTKFFMVMWHDQWTGDTSILTGYGEKEIDTEGDSKILISKLNHHETF